jgi:transposase
MANVLSEEKRQQVLALGRLVWTLRAIEKAIGVRRETSSDYLRAAGIPIRSERRLRLAPKPASEVSADPAGSKPASREGVSTDSVMLSITGSPPAAGRAPSASACEPHRDFIEQQALRLGRNAMAIYQDLVDQHEFQAKYASVKRFVRKLAGTESPEARVVIQTAPGEEAQVDYGEGPMVRDPKSGKYRRTRLFVLTLGFSRKSVRLITFHSSSRIWVELHEEAFRRLGVVPRILVLDNLREGVLKPDIYDPTLNPLYRDMLAHYGITALPCRVGDPDRKGKVESGVGHAQRTPLKGLRFETLPEAQRYLDHWEARWADTRIHGTTKRQVAAMFAEEMPFLQPLPIEPFRYYQYGKRIVHLDGHVEVERAYYSVPPGRIGTAVNVQWDEKQVRILDLHTGELLREHRRDAVGRHHTHREDRPKRTPMSTHDLLRRADRIAAPIGLLCRQIHAREGERAVRRILGVLSLARKHGRDATSDACAAALDLGLPTYRFVRRYLDRRPPLQLSLKQVDPLIRELTHYRDLIAQRTQEDTPS